MAIKTTRFYGSQLPKLCTSLHDQSQLHIPKKIIWFVRSMESRFSPCIESRYRRKQCKFCECRPFECLLDITHIMRCHFAPNSWKWAFIVESLHTCRNSLNAFRHRGASNPSLWRLRSGNTVGGLRKLNKSERRCAAGWIFGVWKRHLLPNIFNTTLSC